MPKKSKSKFNAIEGHCLLGLYFFPSILLDKKFQEKSFQIIKEKEQDLNHTS
jgi:hypothetical protein